MAAPWTGVTRAAGSTAAPVMRRFGGLHQVEHASSRRRSQQDTGEEALWRFRVDAAPIGAERNLAGGGIEISRGCCEWIGRDPEDEVHQVGARLQRRLGRDARLERCDLSVEL